MTALITGLLEMPELYYVSFADPSGWKGAAFMEAGSVVLASKKAGEEGIKPNGDDVQTLAFRYDQLDDVPFIPEDMRNRRLGKEELLHTWPEAEDLMDYEDHL